MKRMEHIRTAIAVLLLSVILPMTLVLPFHHHETEESSALSCDLCTRHQPHSGHLTAEGHLDNCLVCQFLGISYLPEESVAAPSVPVSHADLAGGAAESAPSVQLQLHSPRAPPFSFC